MLKLNIKRLFGIVVAALLMSVLLYIVLWFIPPASILSGMQFKFNTPEKIDNLVFKQVRSLIFFFSLILFIIWFYGTPQFLATLKYIKIVSLKISQYFNVTFLLIISVLYLTVLYTLAISNFDLGYDEAWYIHWSKNFSETGIAYYTTDDKISIIDTITMLPYYLFSPVLFRIGLSEVWQFKLFNSILSVIALLSMFVFLKRTSGKTIAVFSIFYLIMQPGFGFISSSYFGELFQVIFFFAGLYYWLINEDRAIDKRLLLSGFLFSLAIHTKFQLLIILILVFIIFNFLQKNSRSYKILLYTILFTSVIGLLRILPVLLTEPKNIRYLLIMDWVTGNSISQSLSFVAFEKIQLFNRFFPISLFCIIIAASIIYLKKPFEKFLTIFSLTSVLWWIFLFPYTTYRHPFIGILTLCILAATLSVSLYNRLIETKKLSLYTLKYLTVFSVLTLMLYGFSANLIYAYIGYNDGVQFDLDGFKNRLFAPIQRDNSQKDFYLQLKQLISDKDTLYNGSFVTRFYLNNPVYSINSMYNKINDDQIYGADEKLLLITRENYPLGFDKIYNELDSMGLRKRLILKKGQNELLGIKK